MSIKSNLKSSNEVSTKDGNLILDSHKLSNHFERVEAWEKGERVPPVTVDMALTRACGAMCSFCYAMVQEPQERLPIKTQHALNLLDDFAEIGVKGFPYFRWRKHIIKSLCSFYSTFKKYWY